MKQRMLLYGFTLLLGVFALSSCVNEDSVCLPEGSDVKVAFSLVLPDNAQTRAEGDWSDAYNSEIGTDYDNYIDLNGIQVLVFENTSTGTMLILSPILCIQRLVKMSILILEMPLQN